MGFKQNLDSYIEEKKLDSNSLYFDERTHIYTYNGIKLKSVTQILDNYKTPFNSIMASIAKAKKNYREGNGITDAVLLRRYWRTNGRYKSLVGSATHSFAELYVFDRTSESLTVYDDAIKYAINAIENEYDIIEQEKRVFNLEYGVAGTIDLVLRHKKTKEIWIGDWKTTKDFTTSYRKLNGVLKDVRDSNINKFTFQLLLYSWLNKSPKENKMVIKLDKGGKYQIFKDEQLNMNDKLLDILLKDIYAKINN